MKPENGSYKQQTLLALFLLAGSAAAQAADDIASALAGGKTTANLQLRYEDVDNPGKAAPNGAEAITARLRLGYETGTYEGLSAMVEVETIKASDDKTYDGKATGATANGYAIVADPEATEINQAYINYSSIPMSTSAKWGRQRIILDNARFVGNVGWRQNEQTFDALTIVNAALPDTRITAVYAVNANRIYGDNAAAGNAGAFGGNHQMNTTLLNVNYKGWGIAELVGYGYLLNYDTTSAFTANSTDTYGVRMNGKTPLGENKLMYTAEYATQSDGNNNPTQFKTNYYLVEGGLDINKAVFKLGYEELGADMGATTKTTGLTAKKAFSTPLATLHAFNGWADVFLVTPTQGLKDMYVSASTTWEGIKFAAFYHDFSAAESTATIDDYGTEWDVVATKAIGKHYTIGAKYASYKTDNAAVAANTDKLWLWGEVKF